MDLCSHKYIRKWPWLNPVARWVERALAIPNLNQIHAAGTVSAATGGGFCRGVLQAMETGYSLPAGDWQRIPTSGPLVVVANHPIGAPEALVLGDVLDKLRPDYLFLGNYLLESIPALKDKVIAVDPFGGADAARRNLRGMRAAMLHLKRGGTLVVFPAGAVSHLHLRQLTVTDPAWNPHVARLIRQSGATTVAAYFDARNSWMFQLAGLLHPRLRTVLLPQQLPRWKGRMLKFFFSRPITAETLSRHGDDQKAINFLRAAVYVQQGRLKELATPAAHETSESGYEPLVLPVDAACMAEEIEALGEEHILLRQSGFVVCCTAAANIPSILREIGRLREMTFRAVGEGTGKSLDLDAFDQYYRHLFVWNEVTQEVVGAYRLGLTDQILPETGPRGLYTSTLFRYRPGYLRQLGPAIEMGRSFIRPEYQRKYQSLLLLWRGIGEFVARNPQYPMLFGPVSISRDYQTLSRDLMVRFLRSHNSSRWLGWQVRPCQPPRHSHAPGLNPRWFARTIRSIDDVSALVSEIEHDGKGIPILLRHYLKLNARLVSFNVDPAFSDVLDGLILVDMRRSEPQLLKRFLGADAWKNFADFHEMRSVGRFEKMRGRMSSIPNYLRGVWKDDDESAK